MFVCGSLDVPASQRQVRALYDRAQMRPDAAEKGRPSAAMPFPCRDFTGGGALARRASRNRHSTVFSALGLGGPAMSCSPA